MADTPLRQSGILRILICRTSHSLGNTLLLTPLLQEIEAIWPGAEIDIVTRSPVAVDIFSNFANVRHIYCLPKRAMQRPLQLLKHLQSLRRNRYDLAIDTDPRSRTGRALLSRSRARYKVGFVNDRKRGAVTHAVEAALAPEHAGQIPVYLLRSAMHRVQLDYPALDVRLSNDEREQGRQMLDRLVTREDGIEPRTKKIIGGATPSFRQRLICRQALSSTQFPSMTIEPVFWAVTTTPSMLPSASELTVPVSASWPCAQTV